VADAFIVISASSVPKSAKNASRPSIRKAWNRSRKTRKSDAARLQSARQFNPIWAGAGHFLVARGGAAVSPNYSHGARINKAWGSWATFRLRPCNLFPARTTVGPLTCRSTTSGRGLHRPERPSSGFTTSLFSAATSPIEIEIGRLTSRDWRFYHGMYKVLSSA